MKIVFNPDARKGTKKDSLRLLFMLVVDLAAGILGITGCVYLVLTGNPIYVLFILGSFLILKWINVYASHHRFWIRKD